MSPRYPVLLSSHLRMDFDVPSPCVIILNKNLVCISFLFHPLALTDGLESDSAKRFPNHNFVCISFLMHPACLGYHQFHPNSTRLTVKTTRFLIV